MKQKPKYFKIVNTDGHHRLVYHEGYNEDPLPFNPNGDCESGGIYFASTDILAFSDYGTELYEVEPIGEIYENPGEPQKYKAHALNMQYVGKIDDLDTVKYLVCNGVNIHACDEYALRWYAKNGNLEIVKYLVENGADVHVLDDIALCWSANKGHLEVVKYLIEQGANIHAKEDKALRWSANDGHLEVVKYLVEKGADIHANDDYALCWSAENGHLKVVKYLKSLD